MTREEIIEGLKLLEDNMVYFDELLNDKGEYIDVHELLFEAIEALKQEPCEDCISRTEAQKHIYRRLWESALNNVGYECKAEDVFMDIADNRLSTWISEIPSIQPKADVLDKIRAELHTTAEMHEDGDYYLREEWIDEIIDKYKAEKE